MLHPLRYVSIVALATFGVLAIDDTRNPVEAAAGVVGGIIRVQVTLTTNSLPNGTSITLSVSANPEDPLNFDSASLSKSVNVVAGKVTATMNVPYKWAVTNTAEKITIGMYASGSGGANDLFDNTSLTQEITIPPSGTVTTLAFTGTI